MFETLKTLIPNYPIPSIVGTSFVTIYLILATYKLLKHTEIVKDFFNIYGSIKDKEIRDLEKKINSKDYSESEKKIFHYRKKVFKYQRDLKTNETHLMLLIYLSGFENDKAAIATFHNSREYLNFNDKTFILEPRSGLNESKASDRAKLGERVFGFNGILAYFIAMIPFWFFPESIAKTSLIPFFLVLIIFIFGQIYLGWLFMRYMSKHKNAFELPKMKRIKPHYEKDLEILMSKAEEVSSPSDSTKQLLLPDSTPSVVKVSIDIAANAPIVSLAVDQIDEKENKTRENTTAET